MTDQLFYWTGVIAWMLIGGFAVTSAAVCIFLKCCTDLEMLLAVSRLTAKKIKKARRHG